MLSIRIRRGNAIDDLGLHADCGHEPPFVGGFTAQLENIGEVHCHVCEDCARQIGMLPKTKHHGIVLPSDRQEP